MLIFHQGNGLGESTPIILTAMSVENWMVYVVNMSGMVVKRQLAMVVGNFGVYHLISKMTKLQSLKHHRLALPTSMLKLCRITRNWDPISCRPLLFTRMPKRTFYQRTLPWLVRARTQVEQWCRIRKLEQKWHQESKVEFRTIYAKKVTNKTKNGVKVSTSMLSEGVYFFLLPLLICLKNFVHRPNRFLNLTSLILGLPKTSMTR